ncbi:putative transposase [Collimonas pratensis]|uniref:Transposase n=1 Tax=Collimonas pratensis TaxID=279113 RepID=A0ABM5ZCP5_9BURK|nr:putative transposase [Collimonas pratensis]
MVDGRVLYTDSTHLKANANKGKFDVVTVQQTPSTYLAELDAAVDTDRAAHGKKQLKRDDDDTPPTKEIKISRTDPESGYMVRDDKPKGFFYLDHRTVDAKHAIITDTYATPASVHDSVPYLGRLDRQRHHFGFPVSAVAWMLVTSRRRYAKDWNNAALPGSWGIARPTINRGPSTNANTSMTRIATSTSVRKVRRCPTIRLTGSVIANTNRTRPSASDALCAHNAPTAPMA